MMYGQSVIVETPIGQVPRFEAELIAYCESAARMGAIYVDLYRTKHPNRFLMIEVHESTEALDAARTAAWAGPQALALGDAHVTPLSPVMSHPGEVGRPLSTGDLRRAPGNLISHVDDEAKTFGAHVFVHTHPEMKDAFLAGVHRIAARVAENEPGYLFADFYAAPEPGRYVMVEFYKDREALSLHHTREHTADWAEEKKAYESSKHHAFTITPLFSSGRFPRIYTAPAIQGR